MSIWQAGTHLHWPVLFWLPATGRETHLHTLLARHRFADVVVATAATDQPAAHPAGPIWRPAGQPATTRVRLADLPTTGDAQ